MFNFPPSNTQEMMVKLPNKNLIIMKFEVYTDPNRKKNLDKETGVRKERYSFLLCFIPRYSENDDEFKIKSQVMYKVNVYEPNRGFYLTERGGKGGGGRVSKGSGGHSPYSGCR